MENVLDVDSGRYSLSPSHSYSEHFYSESGSDDVVSVSTQDTQLEDSDVVTCGECTYIHKHTMV